MESFISTLITALGANANRAQDLAFANAYLHSLANGHAHHNVHSQDLGTNIDRGTLPPRPGGPSGGHANEGGSGTLEPHFFPGHLPGKPGHGSDPGHNGGHPPHNMPYPGIQ